MSSNYTFTVTDERPFGVSATYTLAVEDEDTAETLAEQAHCLVSEDFPGYGHWLRIDERRAEAFDPITIAEEAIG